MAMSGPLGRLIAQVLVVGGTTLGRAAVAAYQRALQNAKKAGVDREVTRAARRAEKITADEARAILHVESKADMPCDPDEMVKRYMHLFYANEENGSFYLQSKVFRAKERLMMDFPEDVRRAAELNLEQQEEMRRATIQREAEEEAARKAAEEEKRQAAESRARAQAKEGEDDERR